VNPIVAQVLTIAGVLLGSAATFVATHTIERTRWRRAQSSRWDDKRLAAYSVKHMVRLCRRLAAVQVRAARVLGYRSKVRELGCANGQVETGSEADVLAAGTREGGRTRPSSQGALR
jgi:hypothetical protein